MKKYSKLRRQARKLRDLLRRISDGMKGRDCHFFTLTRSRDPNGDFTVDGKFGVGRAVVCRLFRSNKLPLHADLLRPSVENPRIEFGGYTHNPRGLASYPMKQLTTPMWVRSLLNRHGE
jgi:hypothetical protein